jgi:hypothetical protein
MKLRKKKHDVEISLRKDLSQKVFLSLVRNYFFDFGKESEEPRKGGYP